jgi:pimeloyl-ACP methyl ester carboxylesterase
MTIARINDIDLYYEEHGDPSAEPLLLIMGFTMNAASWAPQIPALAKRYHVIAFDNRGAGRTSQPEGPYSIPQMAADAVALLDLLGIESAHIVGASMGGMIAQEFAIRYSSRVRGLVLACTTPGGPHSAGYDEMMKTSEEGLAMTDLSEMLKPENVKQSMDLMFTDEFQAHPGPGMMQMGAAAALSADPDRHEGSARGHARGTMTASRISADARHRRRRRYAGRRAEFPIWLSRIRARSSSFPDKHGFTAEKPDETNAAILDFLARRGCGGQAVVVGTAVRTPRSIGGGPRCVTSPCARWTPRRRGAPRTPTCASCGSSRRTSPSATRTSRR